jgi:hypothetical protein
MGGRVMYRHRHSRRLRWYASQTVAAWSEKPASLASNTVLGASSVGGTLYRVRALRPVWGPMAMRYYQWIFAYNKLRQNKADMASADDPETSDRPQGKIFREVF